MYWNIFRRYTTTWWPLSLWWPQLKGELRSNSAPSIDIEKALQGRSFCDLVSPLGTVRPCLKSGREHRTSVEVKHLLPFHKSFSRFGEFLHTRRFIMLSTKTRVLLFNWRKVILFTTTLWDTRIYTKTFLANDIYICNRILTEVLQVLTMYSIFWGQYVRQIMFSTV